MSAKGRTGAAGGPNDPGAGPAATDSGTRRFPVCVQVPAGWWRLRPTSGPGQWTHGVVAELVGGERGPDAAGPVVVTVAASSIWRLEELLGWPLPTACHAVLEAARARDETAAPPPATRPPDGAYPRERRPWRASLVLLAGRPPATYGRLTHDSPPTRSWAQARLRVDVVPATWRATLTGGHRRRVAYRLTVDGELLFAGDDASVDASESPNSTAAVRNIVATILARPTLGRPFTDRQRRLLATHRRALTAAAQAPSHPYPPGTRVTVTDPHAARPATGTIMGIAAPHHRLIYRWRPDVAELPGHPWRDHPGWALEAPRQQVRATLATPDLLTVNPDGEAALLVTGARVAAIDDPRFEVATVLRAFAGDDPTPRYEIQPHDSGGGPIDVAADDVAGLAGTAWPTLDELLIARAAADLPIRPFEVVLAVRDCAIVTDSPHGPRLHTRFPLADAGIALDPTGRATPINIPPPAAAPGLLASLSTVDGLVRLDHPVHGRLAAPQALVSAAVNADPREVAAIVARVRWLPAGPHPPIVAAVLAALHSPHDVAALTPIRPGPDPGGPPGGQPARDGPALWDLP